MTTLQMLREIAERDIKQNPALGIEGYRKGELQRRVIAAAKAAAMDDFFNE
jgi:hypothetical protein